MTKDHVAFRVVVVDDTLARRLFPVCIVECFFALFVSLFVLSELEFRLVSVWLPISRSSWNARKPSCGCEASLRALERIQARYWSVESFWPFCVPEHTCRCQHVMLGNGLKGKLINFLGQVGGKKSTNLWMPNVKNSGIGCSYNFYIRPNILAIEHHIFASPSKLIRQTWLASQDKIQDDVDFLILFILNSMTH